MLGGVSLSMAVVVARVTFPVLAAENTRSSAWTSYWHILGHRAFSPVGGAYAMALSGFIHQLMAATIGGIASLIASQQAWPLSLLCTLLAVGALLCVVFAPGRRTT
ncbi:hypothetical protein [Pseudomonas farris]